MNKNKHFFDELDNSWGETISNTYEKYNNTTVYDTKNNIKLKLDNIKPEIETGNIEYYEIYEVNNIKLELSLYTFENVFDELQIIYFKLDLYINSNIMNFVNLVFNINRTPKVEVFIEGNTANTISIKHNFLKEYLMKGKEHIKIDNTIYEEFIQVVLNTYQDIN